MKTLRAHGLHYAVGGRALVQGASFSLAAGELVVLLGANGAGKTTLIRLALGLLTPAAGSADIDGADIGSMRPAERARAVAYLPQARPLAWPARVRDVVALGRFAYGGSLGRLGAADSSAVARALTACDLDALADRSADTLSGGELARVHIARALASEAPLIIADEPVAALDPLHQHNVMSMLRRAADAGGGVLCVVHDLSLAARYADRLIWLKAGRVLADGPVQETMTANRIAEVYGVQAQVDDRDVTISGMA